MSQSKYSPLGFILYVGTSYSKALRANPLLVKSITSGLLAAFGNYLAQRLCNKSGKGQLNYRNIAAFAIYGLAYTGPLTHYWLNLLDRYGPSHPLLKLFIDRFLYAPFFLIFALYLLSRLEGSSHASARNQIKTIYWSALKAMWKVWVIVQYVNLNFVPLPYRVLVANVVSVGWNLILSHKRINQKKHED